MAQIVTNGYPTFTGLDGLPLEEGYIFIGIEGQNPLSNPQAAYWDADLTVPASNIRTSNGYAVYQGSPGRLYAANAYSLLVQDKYQSTVYYQPTSANLETSGTAASDPDVAGGLPLGAVLPKNGVTFTGFLDLGTAGLNDSDYPELSASGLDIIDDNGDGTFNILDSGGSTGWVAYSTWANATITVAHSLQKGLTDLDVEVFVSSAGTEATAIKVLDSAYDASSGADSFSGVALQGIGNASFNVRTGTNGLSIVNTDGTQLILTTQNWYYKVNYRRKDMPYPGQISYVSNSFTVDGGDAPTQIIELKFRRDMSANWSSSNPTLALGEAGYATDTAEFKIGDGATPWNSLSVVNTGVTANLAGVIGTDRTFLENDGGTVKVSVGSLIEANGTLYTVTGSAVTPSGTAADNAYLFFDPSGGTYTWSAVPGTVDVVKGAIYDGSGRRQCRWRLTSATTWSQIIAPESESVTIAGEGFRKRLIMRGLSSLQEVLIPFSSDGGWSSSVAWRDANGEIRLAWANAASTYALEAVFTSGGGLIRYGVTDRVISFGPRTMAYGNGQLVAVGNSLDYMWSIDDGVTWTEDILTTVGSAVRHYKVVYADSITTFITMNENGQFLTTADPSAGLEWVLRSAGGPYGTRNNFAYDEVRDQLVMVDDDGLIYTSTDLGATFGASIADSGGSLLVSSGSRDSVFLIGSDGTYVLGSLLSGLRYSTDGGLTWATCNIPSAFYDLNPDYTFGDGQGVLSGEAYDPENGVYCFAGTWLVKAPDATTARIIFLLSSIDGVTYNMTTRMQPSDGAGILPNAPTVSIVDGVAIVGTNQVIWTTPPVDIAL